ncbi:hypothetical protein Tco_1537530, partial [Tanacetum coccineum]
MESSNSNSQERELLQVQLAERQMHSNGMAWFKGIESHLRTLYQIVSWLNEAILHEHEIEQRLKLQSKDVMINTVNALNVNSVIMEDKCYGGKNSSSETAFSKSVNERQ